MNAITDLFAKYEVVIVLVGIVAWLLAFKLIGKTWIYFTIGTIAAVVCTWLGWSMPFQTVGGTVISGQFVALGLGFLAFVISYTVAAITL